MAGEGVRARVLNTCETWINQRVDIAKAGMGSGPLSITQDGVGPFAAALNTRAREIINTLDIHDADIMEALKEIVHTAETVLRSRDTATLIVPRK